MTMQDPLSDMITRIKNASRMGHESVTLPGSKLKESVASVLVQEGYISDCKVNEKPGDKQELQLILKYHKGEPVIEGMERESKPSRRIYVSKVDIPDIRGGLGTAVLSTSHGVISGKEAREAGVGGELLMKVW